MRKRYCLKDVYKRQEQAYCFLVSDNQNAYERLRELVKTNDGFVIAEKDMQLRGTGDMLGTRQHGMGTLKVANLIADMELLIATRDVLQAMKQTCLLYTSRCV